MTRLIRFEFYKLFWKRSILVVLVLFSVINLFKINNEFHSYSYLADGNDSRSWNSVYWQLYENYSGEITTEKINHLLSVTGMIIVTVIMFLSSKNYHCRERRKKCQDLLTN